ncbi:MAG: hypothetical protein ACD_78C00466G0003 [uncultured bacterium (gcode 4)]|uniref:Uncharacterized protein n=1 Tax=uncultured bacterium (gcode 4) TaxID=1234023 RepID=K1XVK2_9BACT|nr:MAG: hypothetical protein ACD_78C00466G0003 [uncultured bacterium (gcode 4)]
MQFFIVLFAKRCVESDKSINSTSDVFLDFCEKFFAFFRVISGKEHLSVFRCLHIRITNGINNGNPKNIRPFESLGIFWIMLQ